MKFETKVSWSLSGTKIQLSESTNSTEAPSLKPNTGTQQSKASIVQIQKLSFVILINHFDSLIIFIFSSGLLIRQINITLSHAIDFRYVSSGPLHIIKSGSFVSLNNFIILSTSFTNFTVLHT
ncbi:hypothetical protein J5751_00580 [bacterium]|nr:hypothetical protein [bacterium]